MKGLLRFLGIRPRTARSRPAKARGAAKKAAPAKTRAAPGKSRVKGAPKSKVPPLKPMYARLAGPEVLAHRTRAMIVREVKRSPGVALPDLAATLGIAVTTVKWHMRTLEREGFVVAGADGRSRRYFPPGTDSITRRQASALKDASRSLIVEIIRNAPGITQERLATEAGLARGTVWHHAKRLEADGVIRSAREGRERRYFA